MLKQQNLMLPPKQNPASILMRFCTKHILKFILKLLRIILLTIRIFFLYCIHRKLEDTLLFLGIFVSPLKTVSGYIVNDNLMDRVGEVQDKVTWFLSYKM